MANSNSNKKLVPEAMSALDKFKYEVANEVGVKKLFKNLKPTSGRYFIFVYLKYIINLLFYFFCLLFYIVSFCFLLTYLYL